jgi:hypothetical protein
VGNWGMRENGGNRRCRTATNPLVDAVQRVRIREGPQRVNVRHRLCAQLRPIAEVQGRDVVLNDVHQVLPAVRAARIHVPAVRLMEERHTPTKRRGTTALDNSGASTRTRTLQEHPCGRAHARAHTHARTQTHANTKNQPRTLASRRDSPRSAAVCINFFGMHPTLTHVPPKPHVEPAGLGFTKSSTATFAPKFDAALEHAKPAQQAAQRARGERSRTATPRNFARQRAKAATTGTPDTRDTCTYKVQTQTWRAHLQSRRQ